MTTPKTWIHTVNCPCRTRKNSFANVLHFRGYFGLLVRQVIAPIVRLCEGLVRWDLVYRKASKCDTHAILEGTSRPQGLDVELCGLLVSTAR